MKQRKFAGGGEMPDDMSPEDVAEMKKRLAATRAYDKAMPEADTMTSKLQGSSKSGSMPGIAALRRKRKESSMPNVDTMGNVTGYAKGGMTASKRADGIAQRGKTRGTMVAMCGGGYAKGK
jgi:hypothetical protein